MKRKYQYLFGAMILAIVVISLFVMYKYTRYRDFLIAAETLPHEFQLAAFYAEFARFPKNADEYLDYVKSEPRYTEKINTTGCYLKYDSLNELIVLYSPGFDGDDDKLQKVYNPYEVTFASSLAKDGDVVLQVRNVAGLLSVLVESRFVTLRESKPDSTLKPVLHRLWDLAKCYLDTGMSDEERKQYSVIPSGKSSEYGYAWVEFRKTDSTTLRVYSELDHSLTRRVEKGLLSEVNKRKILKNEDNIVIGFAIYFPSAFCSENLDENSSPNDGKKQQ